MNRMQAADITQLLVRYSFDMFYCVFYNKKILLKPRIDFLVPIISGKKYGTKDTTKETEVKYCKGVRKVLEITSRNKCNKTTRGNAQS